MNMKIAILVMCLPLTKIHEPHLPLTISAYSSVLSSVPPSVASVSLMYSVFSSLCGVRSVPQVRRNVSLRSRVRRNPVLA